MHRETEDILSGQIESYHKEQMQEAFRHNIRKMAEERLRQEELEREKKRHAAEQRRQAVLERLRKKKEEEEELIRQAELRKQMIEEENMRILRVSLTKGTPVTTPVLPTTYTCATGARGEIERRAKGNDNGRGPDSTRRGRV